MFIKSMLWAFVVAVVAGLGLYGGGILFGVGPPEAGGIAVVGSSLAGMSTFFFSLYSHQSNRG